MITLEVNGKPETIPHGSTVTDLLTLISSEGNTVATVVNDCIIRPDKRPVLNLQQGDRVEILVFAGGG
ncbi:MAG: sulfur carrier protein ThiS [Chlorobiaceae bacterium]|nr:sulfur carrier protein ThiS [Chlorobiaceae bacterium]